MRLVSFVVVIAVGAFVAYFLYWQHRLEPLLDAPGAAAVPTPLPLAQPGGAVRHLDLGYVAFDLPASLAGDPVQHGTSLYVSLAGSDMTDSELTICPPISEQDADVRALRHQFAELTGRAAPSYWELRKQALSMQPFSVWWALFRGKRRLVGDAALLLMKTSELNGTESFAWHEDDHFGLTVATRDDHVFIQLADKKAGISQLFMLARSSVDVAVFARTLLDSYRLSTTDFRPEALQALLKQAGLPRQVTASARADSALGDVQKQEAELKTLLERLRARREARDAPHEGSGSSGER